MRDGVPSGPFEGEQWLSGRVSREVPPPERSPSGPHPTTLEFFSRISDKSCSLMICEATFSVKKSPAAAGPQTE